MSRNELPEEGDWSSVNRAIRRLMAELDLSLASLSRESGISETTIRYIGRPEKRQRSTLVALAGALECPHDYLVDVLRGTADPGAQPQPPADLVLLGLMSEKLDEMRATIYEINGKVETILDRR